LTRGPARCHKAVSFARPKGKETAIDPRRGARLLDTVWLLVCVTASTAWCVTAAGHLSATFDEPLYLRLGLDAWRTGSQRGLLRMGVMPLPANVQTLPLRLAELARGRPWDADSDFETLLPWFRAGTLPFWWLLLTVSFLAARRLGGSWAARLAVAVLACEPNLLAHAGLGTTDISLAACLLLFVYVFRTGRGAGWGRRVGLPMFCFGLLLSAKASGLVFGPLCALAAESERLWSDPNRAPWSWSPRRLLTAFGPLLRDWLRIGPGGLALTFLYCGCDFLPEPSFVAWAHTLPPGRWHDFWVFVSENLRVFSNAGEALVRQVKHNLHGHDGTFLLGVDYARPVWYYFPVVLSIKLPWPPLLLLLAAALVRPRGLVNWATAAALLLFLNTVTCRVQIGIRFLLPVLALFIIGLSAAAVRGVAERRNRLRRSAVAGLAAACVVWMAVESVGVWPDGLRYVNGFWGGADRGYLLVSDSNYDWGQGLPELAEWRRRRGEPVAVWYFGSDPSVERQSLELVPLHGWPPDQVTPPHGLPGRYLAVGVTLLYGHPLTEAHRRAATYLRTKRPVARTGTFLIYDLSSEEGDRP